MTISFPYALPFLADKLKIANVVFDIQRNDERSGTGDGRVWQAELAPPLWLATVNLTTMLKDDGKQIAAKIRALGGAQNAFFLYDPQSQYPQKDPTGSILGSAAVKVNTIAGTRTAISLKGLPANYRLTTGDKIQINYSSSPTRYAFLEVSEDIQASAGGITPEFSIFPRVPAGLVTNLDVILKKPAMKALIMPGSHNPGTSDIVTNTGATFKAIQKK